MRFIPTRIHGMTDYVVGLLLIVAPWLFDFANGGPEQWVPIIIGSLTIGQSLMTDYELGVVRVIPMPTHLLMDMAAGAVLALSPWIFGFADVIWWPHVVVGLLEIVLPLITHRQPDDGGNTPDAYMGDPV